MTPNHEGTLNENSHVAGVLSLGYVFSRVKSKTRSLCGKVMVLDGRITNLLTEMLSLIYVHIRGTIDELYSLLNLLSTILHCVN